MAGLPRRHWLAAAAGGLLLPSAALALPTRPIAFPRDHGAHPDFRTEWWYITGQAHVGERLFGFQLTFFRTRVDAAQPIASGFAAKQLVFAHAALTDVQGKRLHHDQRIAREGFGIAQAGVADTQVVLRDWSLTRAADGSYAARLPADGFTLDLRFTPTQDVLLQGTGGLSRKGPDEKQASYYYSQPQLRASGRVRLAGRDLDVTGTAWLDHEWSEELLHPQAVGWDWIGMNLLDGSALTAFRLRRADGGTLWDGGSLRAPGRAAQGFRQGEVAFSPLRRWTSPASRASYPVEWTVRTPGATYTVRAVIDDQELDSRASTGSIYWEGLSDLVDSQGRTVGRGYLEMTGYAKPLTI